MSDERRRWKQVSQTHQKNAVFYGLLDGELENVNISSLAETMGTVKSLFLHASNNSASTPTN
jgi:hypothetical protein